MNLLIKHYFEKNPANLISSQYNIQCIKTAASDASMQHILESLRHKRKLVHEELPWKKKGQNVSKSNSDEAVSFLLTKITDDKTWNVLTDIKHNPVSLTKSYEDKKSLHKYYLHNKEKIRQ